MLHLMLSMWVASEACAVFPAARDSGALELLLSTPLSVPEILRGQMLSLERQFFSPAVIVVALYCAALLAGSLRPGVETAAMRKLTMT